MTVTELVKLCEQGKRRWHLVGSGEAGVLALLDLEGRLYICLGGEVLNRVNPDAFLRQTDRTGYLNPGGDGLWPAPEGTTLGYEYPTGAWRVPPGLTGARYAVVRSAGDSALVAAEVDLVNNAGLGVPVVFSREIEVAPDRRSVAVTIREAIEYIGARRLPREECLLVPWTLCQFDSGPGCEVLFPAVPADRVWDFYGDSSSQRRVEGDLWRTKTDGAMKYQIGLPPETAWIEYRDPARGLTVRRTARPPAPGLSFVDIADRPAGEPPRPVEVRYSVYSDPSCFMEIEAAGACGTALEPGGRTELTVETVCSLGD